MAILERDRAIFGMLKKMRAQDEPVWFEDLCRDLRNAGYETVGRGSIVKEMVVVLRYWSNRPKDGYMGYRIVEVQTDRYKLVAL